jgi:outer membrane protein assembly factor BamB
MRLPGYFSGGWRVHLAILSGIAAVGASTAARADDWPSPGLDAARTRLTPERSGAIFGDARWSVSGGAHVLASPVVADGYVVTVDLAGSVRALRADDGQLVWQVPLGVSVQGTPAISRGRVFVPTVANQVVAMRLVDGHRLWARDVGGMVVSSPASIENDLVLAAGLPSRQLVRLSGATGELVWMSPPVMEQFSNSSPAVGDGLVVVGCQGGHYYAFDAGTSEPRWSYAADGVVNLASPLIAAGRVFMAGGDKSNRVYAVDSKTGVALAGWPIELPARDPDIAGKNLGRTRAVSSLASIGGLVLLATRLDDAMDTDANGTADRFLSRESVLALDPTSGAITWEYAVGRAEFTEQVDVPKFFVSPTPAAFSSDRGSLVAAASSLSPTIVVLDAAHGIEQQKIAVAGPSLASPVLANARLISVAISGSVDAIMSSVNHPPSAPILSSYARSLDAADVTLRWLPATDPDAELPSYEIRIDSDGEVLESWQYRMYVGAGVTALHLDVPLSQGVTYSYAVRARDTSGALSAWSLPETFSVTVNPAVTVGGKLATSLRTAVDAASPGDVIMLGAGTYTLNQTLNVGPGVALQGDGAGRTTVDATRLGAGIDFDHSTPDHASRLEGLTIAGADTCIQISEGATGVQIRRVIVRDCRIKGVAVRAGGAVDIANATLVGSGTGIQASGKATIKNSLLTDDAVALSVEAPGVLTSSYNDLFGNPKNYEGLTAGQGDLSEIVAFADYKTRDLRLVSAQPSTDRGDPTDDVGQELAPNGGRINLGAFGGTADAEVTAPSTAVGGPSAAGATPTTDPGHAGTSSPASPQTNADEQVGCGVAPTSDPSGLAAALWYLTAVLVRRRHRTGHERRS